MPRVGDKPRCDACGDDDEVLLGYAFWRCIITTLSYLCVPVGDAVTLPSGRLPQAEYRSPRLIMMDPFSSRNDEGQRRQRPGPGGIDFRRSDSNGLQRTVGVFVFRVVHLL